MTYFRKAVSRWDNSGFVFWRSYWRKSKKSRNHDLPKCVSKWRFEIFFKIQIYMYLISIQNDWSTYSSREIYLKFTTQMLTTCIAVMTMAQRSFATPWRLCWPWAGWSCGGQWCPPTWPFSKSPTNCWANSQGAINTDCNTVGTLYCALNCRKSCKRGSVKKGRLEQKGSFTDFS